MLTKDLFDQIVTVLQPEMGDADARRALIESALYGSPLLQKIQWGGPARPFTVRLVRELDQFGEIEPGKAAIIALLEETRKHVGAAHQARIDRLVDDLSLLKVIDAESSPENEAGLSALQPGALNIQQPANLTQYRLERIEEWSHSRYHLDWSNLLLAFRKAAKGSHRAVDRLHAFARRYRYVLPWLGFVVYPTHRRVKARNVVKFSRRLRERWSEYCGGKITFAEFDASVQGWINHVSYADSWGLRTHALGQGLVYRKPES
jgi:hypothetical protein